MKSIYSGLLLGVAGCTMVLSFPATAAAHAKEKVLYSFGSGTDGAQPKASLLAVKGTLYGTTTAGGANNAGTVFSFDPKTATEHVVYSFQNSSADGQDPKSALIDVQGTLYGTTFSGGANGAGTVFSVDPATGVEKIVYSFQNTGSDGENPAAALLDVNGTLYGTTQSGDPAGYGTVFSIDLATGAETVLHEFGGTDGKEPAAALIDMNGTLYSTTILGGANGNGTVFSYDPTAGVEATVYSFCSQTGCTDGANPYASLIDVKGTLYGTTLTGGANCPDVHGCGTAFSLDAATGAETVLHSFAVSPDATYPSAGLVELKGELYGTTQEGGANCTSIGGCGAAFAVKLTTGAEKVLHSFGSGTDGAVPDASLINVKGTLYGTTYSGGAYGYGTVFEIKKP